MWQKHNIKNQQRRRENSPILASLKLTWTQLNNFSEWSRLLKLLTCHSEFRALLEKKKTYFFRSLTTDPVNPVGRSSTQDGHRNVCVPTWLAPHSQRCPFGDRNSGKCRATSGPAGAGMMRGLWMSLLVFFGGYTVLYYPIIIIHIPDVCDLPWFIKIYIIAVFYKLTCGKRCIGGKERDLSCHEWNQWWHAVNHHKPTWGVCTRVGR